MKKLIYLFCFFLLFSCTKDRVIEIEPTIYFPEVWKKDSLVYSLSDTLGNILTEETTYFGSSVPDTLTLRYDDNMFVRNYLIEGDEGVSLDVDSGSFMLGADSIIMYGIEHTARFRLTE